jgi:fumarate hydratase subunit alpha
MRQVPASAITEAVSGLFKQCNFFLSDDVLDALKKARRDEESRLGREALDSIIANSNIAAAKDVPLCQDCGTAVVFLEIGQDVRIEGDSLEDAVDEGVRRAYNGACLRKSMVARPFSARRNNDDNTPAVIHTRIVPGDRIRISVMSKGGGAENMARLGMLLPSAGRRGVVDFVVKTVEEAGSRACPPLVIGVGIGGTAEKAMVMAKHALLRNVGQPGVDEETEALEREILEAVNKTGIGPMGYGGRFTALAVHVETFPTHIASLPVAVNLQCHSDRHASTIL